MTGLALQIDGKWAVLSDDASVSIEGNSPVWGEGNSFSLPFELDIEANRHILGNADQITGQSVYEVLDGKRAVLYTLGIPVYYGKIKMDDEVELSEGTVDVTLVSGNLTFEEMIDGMNCQDVELKDEIVIGTELNAVMAQFGKIDNNETGPNSSFPNIGPYMNFLINIEAKKHVLNVDINRNSTINTSDPYSKKAYCNIPVAVQNQESETLEYIVMGADRPATGICFYVLYFLDCLFSKLGVAVIENHLPEMEDMNRLAFFSTACEYKTKSHNWAPGECPFSFADFNVSIHGCVREVLLRRNQPSGDSPVYHYEIYNAYNTYISRLDEMIATSKNFPNVDVSDCINSVKSAFGVCMIYDERVKTVRLLYFKDILRSSDCISLNVEVHEAFKVENLTRGFELSYSSGSDDNTSFHYDDYTTVNDSKSYLEVRRNVTPYDKTLYIDKKTGDAFRIKVDEDATKDSEKSLNPSLFEVGEFVSAKYGDCTNESLVEKKEISFAPVIANDVSQTEGTSELVVFVDVEVKPEAENIYLSNMTVEYPYDYQGGYEDSTYDLINKIKLGIIYEGIDYESDTEEGNPINKYDTGFTLGFIRPGEGSTVVDDEQNYDGEGNFKYYFVAKNSAFISDTIDHYGNVYDYNGQLDGGVDQSERISLKPRAEKPNPEGGFYPITESYAQRRGLFDKFYSEYAYFVVNRKIVKMKCRMEMADLLNIDWTKRYKIGEYVGFINKYSYSVSSTGISDVELEMYYV